MIDNSLKLNTSNKLKTMTLDFLDKYTTLLIAGLNGLLLTVQASNITEIVTIASGFIAIVHGVPKAVYAVLKAHKMIKEYRNKGKLPDNEFKDTDNE